MINGKLKRTLKDRCPECGSILQIRVRTIYGVEDGIEISNPEEYITCSKENCDYEEKLEQKRRRKQNNILEV